VKRSWGILVLLVVVAPPAMIASFSSSSGSDSGACGLTITPALACSGYTSIPAIPRDGIDGKAPIVASNSRVLLYDSPSVLTKAPSPEDTFVLVAGSALGTATELPFQRRDVFDGLVEILPTAPLKPGQEYTLIWKVGGGSEPRAQAHFVPSEFRDEKAPRLHNIGPVTITDANAPRSSCDSTARRLVLPFNYEDESPVVVGVWEGAKVEGDPLGFSAVWKNEISIQLSDKMTTLPTNITIAAIDVAGHRSAPCTIAVTEPPKRSRFGCGKSGGSPPKAKDCRL